MSTLEAARDYIRRGLIVIPLQRREKKPVAEGWPQLRLKAPDLPRYFGNGTNVGLLLGDDGGLCDVDLDCLEAIAAAIELLPDTSMIFGRKTKPISHYLYRTDPAVRTKKYLDPLDRKKGLIELRGLKSDGSIGLQTMVPPSTHPCGEMVRFVAGFDQTPANVDAATLQSAVARVAAAAALARYFPDEKGGRNMAFLALAGAAARAGWTLERAVAFHRALYRILWGHSADFEQAKAEVKATYDKHAAGSPVTARTSLEGLINARVVSTAFQWLGWSTAQTFTSSAEQTRHAEAADDWPAPEPLDALPAVEAFDEELLPESLRPMVVDIAKRMQLPLDLPAVAVVAALSGAISRRALMQPKDRDTSWVEVPNLWAALIAMPGIGKSPLMNMCVKPLLTLEQRWRQEYETLAQEHAVKEEENKLARRAWEQQYISALKEGTATPPRPAEAPGAPACRRIVINDATYEKLHKAMNENPAGVMLVRDELTGWLSRLDREEYAGERGFALTSWSGTSSYLVERISRGDVPVPHCCLSVLGGITPERLRGYLAQSPHDSPTSDGLIQRFQLAVMPEIPETWKYVNEEPHAASQQVAAIFEYLTKLDHQTPKVYRFSPDAQELFVDWLTDLQQTIRSRTLPGALQSHLSKYPKLMVSLALQFELVDAAAAGIGTDAVSLTHAAQAADWIPYLRRHAERIYSTEVTPEFRAAALLATKIRDHNADVDGVLEVRRVYRHHWEGLSSPETVKAAAEVLVDAGWLREIGEPTGGRPANRYQVNPRVWL
jgi:putative DNA primase/helicase